MYPGANPKVIAETVAAPLEQQINGVEGMLYMFSQSTADGAMTLTVTFALGSDLDNAQVQVQNRVAQASAAAAAGSPARRRDDGEGLARTSSWSCTSSRRTSGTTCCTSRTTRTCVSRTSSPASRGVGSAQVFGAGEYSMRVWLDPNRLAARQLTATDVVRAIREQNIQVAAGVLGGAAVAERHDLPAFDQRAGASADRGSVRRHRRARRTGRPDHADS